MEGHYTFLGEAGLTDDTQKVVTAFAVMAVLFVLSKLATSRLAGGEKTRDFVVPEEKVTLLGYFDFFIEAFLKFHDSVVGKENRKYASFSGSVFIFILFANLLGLVPGMAAATTTVQINVGLALAVFFYFNFLGIRSHGILGYLKHFCGPNVGNPLIGVFVVAILFPVEIISVCLRPLTLNLRLYWNVTADHLVLGIFTDQVWPGVGILGLPFYALGTFVSFMQAFVFTMLTMLYVLFAVQHEEH